VANFRPYLVFSPNGKMLAAVQAIDEFPVKSTIWVWDVASSRQIWKRSDIPGWLQCAAFSPDGRTLAVGGSPGGALFQLRDASTGRLVFSARGDNGLCFSVAFSPSDGKLVATASNRNLTTLWDTVTGKVVRSLPNPVIPLSLSFSPDGRRLATGDGDGVVKLWELRTGREILTLRGLAGDTHIAFSPDGRWLGACDLMGNVRLWDAASREEVAEREAREGASR
jgi:WD40 repeat protein